MATILIADDNVDNLELMVLILKSHGYKTITAHNGTEAINLTKKENPHLIICDIQMPDLTGYEVVNLLKQDNKFKEIPIIAVTAHAMAGDRDKILAAGFDFYIDKPINPEIFVEQIEAYLPENLRLSVQLPPK